jgi:uridine phosphorylase
MILSLKSGPMSAREPVHLRPTAALAERVLLPGDPGRALALAQALLQEPLMFNHRRGLWGYTGTAEDGAPMTIQATGMGGPSAAIVLMELIMLGAKRAVRVGTCGGLSSDLGLGEMVLAREAIAADGTSKALGVKDRVRADGPLTESLARAAPQARAGTILSVDLFYAQDGGPGGIPAGDHQAIAVEMEASTLFALGAAHSVPVGCLLTVSDTFDEAGGRSRIEDEELLEAAVRMGRTAVAALS